MPRSRSVAEIIQANRSNNPTPVQGVVPDISSTVSAPQLGPIQLRESVLGSALKAATGEKIKELVKDKLGGPEGGAGQGPAARSTEIPADIADQFKLPK